MQTYDKPSNEGLVAEKEYGLSFHANLTNEALAMASKKNWELTLQIAFPRLEITYARAWPETALWMMFEVCFRAPYATAQEPVYFSTVGRLIADHITETLGCGNLDTVETTWVSGHSGTPKEISDFFYTGRRVYDRESIADRLTGMWSGTQQAGKLAVVAIGGILAIKLVDVVRK